MTSVFLDTVGLIAVWDDTDQWHSVADRAYRQLQRSGKTVVTTTAVLLECGNAAARRPYRAEVNQLRQALIAASLLVEPTPDDVADAWTAYDRGDGAQAGIVDQISFAVMRRLQIHQAFTNDKHFIAAGFAVLF